MGEPRSNFRCNDCEREFVSRKAWNHHGSISGHNINGDLPGKQEREVSELQDKLAQCKQAYELVNEENSKLRVTVQLIGDALFLLRGR